MEIETDSLIPFQHSKTERSKTVALIKGLFKRKDVLTGRTCVRALTKKEVDVLCRVCSCRCDDWSKISVMFSTVGQHASSDLSQYLSVQISQCLFAGDVVIGLCLQHDSLASTQKLPHGIHSNTLITNSIIEAGARVYNNTSISNCFVGSSASILNCGSIDCIQSFSDAMKIDLGPESGGGRQINISPESTLIDISSSLSLSQMKKDLLFTATEIPYSIILGHVHNTADSSNIFISRNAAIKSCSSLKDVILLPNAMVENSALKSVFLQWNASICNHSSVTSTLLMECSAIGPNSIVASTVLGPDSHVSCGEVHCSLIGPNVNSHHQSLLISALWPLGRGNVGYGSNIGSNHTGRLPDQECTVGEGIFWGLGCIIKYPVDLSRCHYSVIAAGVQLPPQRIAMPFSLIMNSGKASQNEIIPGWLLQYSPYTIERNEEKFRNRRKSVRHGFYCGWDIVRPSIIDACLHARDQLHRIDSHPSYKDNVQSSNHFTDVQLSDLGKNFMTVRGKKIGIQAYSNLIQRYALAGFFERIETIFQDPNFEEEIKLFLNKSPAISAVTQAKINGSSWPVLVLPWEENLFYNNKTNLLGHKRKILLGELPLIVGEEYKNMHSWELTIVLLLKYIEAERKYAEEILKSKKRDDKRGLNIIPRYDGSHIMAEDDNVVQNAKNKCEEICSRAERIIHIVKRLQSKL